MTADTLSGLEAARPRAVVERHGGRDRGVALAAALTVHAVVAATLATLAGRQTALEYAQPVEVVLVAGDGSSQGVERSTDTTSMAVADPPESAAEPSTPPDHDDAATAAVPTAVEPEAMLEPPAPEVTVLPEPPLTAPIDPPISSLPPLLDPPAAGDAPSSVASLQPVEESAPPTAIAPASWASPADVQSLPERASLPPARMADPAAPSQAAPAALKPRSRRPPTAPRLRPSDTVTPTRSEAIERVAATPAAASADRGEGNRGDAASTVASHIHAGPPVILDPRFRRPPSPPIYPPRALELEQRGEVIVRALVNEAGDPEEVRLWRSSGFDLLDRAALAAVRRWAFEPARLDERAVRAWVQVPVRFQLK